MRRGVARRWNGGQHSRFAHTPDTVRSTYFFSSPLQPSIIQSDGAQRDRLYVGARELLHLALLTAAEQPGRATDDALMLVATLHCNAGSLWTFNTAAVR